MNLYGKSLIGFRASEGDEASFKARNPTTGELMEPGFPAATGADIEKATSLAWSAFESYRHASGKRRAAFLRGIADRIDSLSDALVDRACAETGLPESRIRTETGRTTGQLRLFADLVEEGSWVRARIDRADPHRKPMPRPDIRSMAHPLGPVVVFGASNFPLAFSVAGGDTASALAAGCPVIVKAHPSHPGTSEIVARAVIEVARQQKLPEGVFSILFDSGHSVGKALVRHPNIKAVGFTGSRAGGTSLMEIAAQRSEPIPVYAEMSSINPVFLLPSAFAGDGKQLAQALCGSVNLGVGQFCTNPGLVLYLKSDDAANWVSLLHKEMEQAASGVLLNEGIHQSYQNAVLNRSGEPKAKALLAVTDNSEKDGFRASPSLFHVQAKDFIETPSLAEEIFGPETTLVEAADQQELIATACSLEGQLTISIFGTEVDFKEFESLIKQLHHKAGRILFNAFPTGVEVCHAMVHGGPYPSTSDGRSTSVGTLAIDRFTRPIAYQNAPPSALPPELREDNPLGILRLVDGEYQR